MLYCVFSPFLWLSVYLMKKVPSNHGNHARYATLSSASYRSSQRTQQMVTVANKVLHYMLCKEKVCTVCIGCLVVGLSTESL